MLFKKAWIGLQQNKKILKKLPSENRKPTENLKEEFTKKNKHFT